MSMLFKNAKEVEKLQAAINECEGDVILRRCDGSEEFNMKSLISRYVAFGKLCDEHGDEYELFASNKADEQILLQYFTEINR